MNERRLTPREELGDGTDGQGVMLLCHHGIFRTTFSVRFTVVASSPRNEAIHLPSRSIEMEIKLTRHQLHCT